MSNVKGLIMPSSSLGSPAVLGAIENKIPVYAIRENKTVLNVTKEIFNKNCDINMNIFSNKVLFLYDNIKYQRILKKWLQKNLGFAGKFTCLHKSKV